MNDSEAIDFLERLEEVDICRWSDGTYQVAWRIASEKRQLLGLDFGRGDYLIDAIRALEEVLLQEVLEAE